MAWHTSMRGSIFLVLQFAGVDHHGPVFCEERFGTFANAGLRPM
jgi:hypothetical protein